jgi:hypothetical protein
MGSVDCNLEAGLRMVEAGMPVHPCNPNPRPHPQSKKPYTAWKSSAAILPAGVRYFSSRYPGCIYGVVLSRIGAVVIDLDRHGGPDGVAEFDQMLDYFGDNLDGVPIVETASGGFHMWFAQPDGEPLGNSEGSISGLGINIRGDGGFVIGPGCVMSDGTFYDCVKGWPDVCDTVHAKALRPIFPWFAELVRAPPPGREPADLRCPVSPAVESDASERLKRVRKILELATNDLARMPPNSGRNQALNNQAMRFAGWVNWCGITEHEVWNMFMAACQQNGLLREDGPAQCHATFKSGWTAGLLKPLSPPLERILAAA